MKDRNGFTLVEMIAVIVIATILITMAARGLNGVLDGNRLEEASRMLNDEINMARQSAAARNEMVQLRFIKIDRDGNPPAFRQVQAGSVDRKTGAFKPMKAPSRFPVGVVMASGTDASPLFCGTLATNASPAYSYHFVNIRPTGEIEPFSPLKLTDFDQWCVTVIPEKLSTKSMSEINDFVTLQINPLTSRTQVHRPR